jgi:hypothetical protein
VAVRSAWPAPAAAGFLPAYSFNCTYTVRKLSVDFALEDFGLVTFSCKASTGLPFSVYTHVPFHLVFRLLVGQQPPAAILFPGVLGYEQ